MQSARFAELLRNRREQLRLTIPQAAKVLRMRESVLVAFEAGDFNNLPPLGYAQGMVSSYARYLGLDPLEITSLYEDEHADYVAAATGHRPTGLASLSDEPAQRNPASAALRPSQNISQSPAQGTVRPRRSEQRFESDSQATSVMRPTQLPQRFDGRGASEQSFYDQSTNRVYSAPTEHRYSDEIRYGSTSAFQDRNGSQRRYTQRVPERSDDVVRRSQAGRMRRARSSEDAYGYEYGRSQSSSYERSASRDSGRSPYASSYEDDIQTRYVGSGEYRDDLRYDSEATSFRASSTRAGREGMRNSAPVQRPNVRRQSSRRQDSYDLRANLAASQNGIMGYVQAFFADPQRAMLTIGVVLVIALLFVLITSVSSCVQANGGAGRQVSVVTTLAATTSDAATTASETEQQVLSEAAAQKAASADAAAYTTTVVKISVADGATSWVEITVDGEQTVAESITGPWEVEYTVKQSISIQVVDPSSVTVEKNGQVQSFSTKSAGLSSLSIQGTDPEAAAAATASTTDAADDSEDDSEE